VTATPPVGIPDVESAERGGFAGVVSRLAAVNALGIVAAFVSGPILARALGAEGRGELAAIVVLLSIAPWLLDLGLAHWVARERARGVSREEVLGTALPVALASSLVALVAAIPLSRLLGGDRDVVVLYLQLGLFLTPVGVVLFTLSGLVIGESRWNLLAATRAVGTVLPVVAIVVLWIGGALTVGSAAASILLAMLASALMPLGLVRGVRRLPFDLRRVREATTFGVKNWLASISATTNVRFDQVLMVGLVSSRELGLYAVAVSIASLTSGLILAVSSALYPRVSRGEGDLAARSCRMTIVLVAAAAVLLAALSPAIPFVFGEAFRGAVTMTLILLLASLPLSAGTVLASALTAAGNPAAPMRAELIAAALTIPALVIMLPAHGGTGAAVISIVAYGARFGMLWRSATSTFQRPATSFVLATRGDFAWLAECLRGALRGSAAE
jgi:O-antigen/teichoic acid export membrane protein